MLRRISVALAALLALSVLGCGLLPRGNDNDRATSRTNDGGQQNGDAGKPQKISLEKSVWYAGFQITVTGASYTPDGYNSELAVDVTIKNDGDDYTLNMPSNLRIEGRDFTGRLVDVPTVPGNATTKGKLGFTGIDDVGDLKKGVLTIGNAEDEQVVVPLGDEGELVANEPKKVLTNGAKNILALTFTNIACDVRADLVANHQQAKKGTLFFACSGDIQYRTMAGRSGSQNIQDENFRLKLPDGTVVAPNRGPNELLNQEERATGVLWYFEIKKPGTGNYEVQLLDRGFVNSDKASAQNTTSIPVTVS